MVTEQEFIEGIRCGNCGAFVLLARQYHQMGLVFKVWQCKECGWVREYSGPPETVVLGNPNKLTDLCLIHKRRLSHVADDGDGKPIYDCIACMKYSGPPETVVLGNPNKLTDLCLIHGRRLSHVADDGDGKPIYDCIACMMG